MIEEREELMVSANGEGTPKLRKAHFLQPTFDPRNQSLPKSPFLPFSSKPNMNQLKKSVIFKGRPKPKKTWQIWVDCLRKTHQKTWEKVGIFDAIMASIYTIRRDELVLELTENWCPETNTFIFKWGECTITLEDVLILGGFSVLGECVETPFHNKEIAEIGDKIMNDFIEERGKSKSRVGPREWMDYFMGIGGELEHMAFLILWLSKYVFPSKFISQDIFPIAVGLAKGMKISLAPAILACIYRELSLLKNKIIGFMNERVVTKLVLWAPFQLVQLWAWERFPMLAPAPNAILCGEPRLACWQDLKKPKNGSLRMMFDASKESFVWRPYACLVENWDCPEFYGDEERLVLINSEVGEELLSFVKCLRPCKLVGLDCCEQYLPHRVALQFGMDQDIPSSMPRLEFGMSVDGVKLYLSPRSIEGDVTTRYFDWFRKELCLENHVENTKTLPCKSPNILKTTLIKNLDAEKNEGSLSCLISPCNVSISSIFHHGTGQNSEYLPCQSPMKQSQNGNKSVENNSKGDLPYLSSSCNVATDSELVESVRERCIESIPFCESQVNINEIIPSQSSAIITTHAAVSGVDSLMDKRANIIGLVHVASVADVLQIADTEKQGGMDTKMTCTIARDKEDADDKHEIEEVQIEPEKDSGPIAAIDELGQVAAHESAEVQMKPEKYLGLIAADDDQGREAAELVNMNLGNGSSVGDPLITDDDSGTGNHNVIGTDFDTRISKLEAMVHRMYAAKLAKSKAK